jgi:hypothetical protein
MKFNIEKFLFDTPIYTKVEIDELDYSSDEFNALFYSEDAAKRPIEGYSPWRKVDSTFSIVRRLTYENNNFKTLGGFGTLIIECKRYHDSFRFYMYYDPDKEVLIKIGQFPTVADFHIGEIKEYKKVIDESKLKELTRAIGLAANGVGIGSFVYLRRVFEHLIFDAYERAKKEQKVSESDFQKARMDEKIELLRTYLPTFLVDNKTMYSILSLGIHELDEQTCLAHFDTLKVGIEIILDEKLDEFKKKEKIEKAKKKLTELKSKVKK